MVYGYHRFNRGNCKSVIISGLAEADQVPLDFASIYLFLLKAEWLSNITKSKWFFSASRWFARIVTSSQWKTGKESTIRALPSVLKHVLDNYHLARSSFIEPIEHSGIGSICGGVSIWVQTVSRTFESRHAGCDERHCERVWLWISSGPHRKQMATMKQQQDLSLLQKPALTIIDYPHYHEPLSIMWQIWLSAWVHQRHGQRVFRNQQSSKSDQGLITWMSRKHIDWIQLIHWLG